MGNFLPLTLLSSSIHQGIEIDFGSNPSIFFKERLPLWGFGEFERALEKLTENFPVLRAVEELTQIYDHLPGWDTGNKDRGALMHITHQHIHSVLDRIDGRNGIARVILENAGKLGQPKDKDQVLVVDARGFKPEGIDHLRVLSCFLDHAHRHGMEKIHRIQSGRSARHRHGNGFRLNP